MQEADAEEKETDASISDHIMFFLLVTAKKH